MKNLIVKGGEGWGIPPYITHTRHCTHAASIPDAAKVTTTAPLFSFFLSTILYSLYAKMGSTHLL
jgi:hypothetical protein